MKDSKFRFFVVLVALLVFSVGCTSSVTTTTTPGTIINQVALGQEFALSIGQSAAVAGESLSIKFIQVISDSRCPKGAVCIWAGEASCLIEITSSETKYSKVLTQPGPSSPAKTNFADYDITFDLQPYPEVGKEIDKKDYLLQLVISEKPALSGGILVTFDVGGEKYSIFITNKETIEQVFALQRNESEAKIPSGRLLRGSVPYNEPWSWHIDSEDIHMAEVTIELCDGTPSQVEDNLDYWVNSVQRFCPWNAKVVKIEDFR